MWRSLATLTALCLAPPVYAAAVPASGAGESARSGVSMHIDAAKKAMLGDPARALEQARQAGTAAERLPDEGSRSIALATSLWLQGEALSRMNDPVSARPLVDEALALVEKAQPKRKLHGDLLMTRAAIAGMTGNVQSALHDLQQAYSMFASINERRSQSLALQDIGSIHADAGDFARVLKYYTESAEIYRDDPAISMSLHNNIGTAHREMGDHAAAEREFRKALTLAKQAGSPLLEARILTNIASAQLAAGRLSTAKASADAAYSLTRFEEARSWRPFLWGVQAQIAAARGDYGAAEELIGRTFAGVDLTNTTMPYREFHKSAYGIYAKRGDSAKALTHLEAFKRLDDEAHVVMASTNAALMSSRFDFTTQELRIAKLKAGQLQRDVALAKSESRLNSLQLYGLYAALAVAALLVAGSMIAFFSIRRSRNDAERANRSLREANEALENALTAKTRFLATTSHEIRTPLNGILGMAQVMLEDRTLVEEHRERVRILYDAGVTMKALVDDILDLAKIEKGKLVIEREQVELKPLLEGVARLWTGQAASKGLALTVDIEGCPERILGDARRLRQIVFNLMSNAVKFTERGGVALSAGLEDDELVLRVRDDGIGIPPDQIHAVFNSFHQVDGGLNRRYGGTGLGLAICRDLVGAMGGTLEVDSHLGRGSCFIVRLPCEAPTDTQRAEGAFDQPWPGSLQSASLLVVENNPLTRSVIAASLTQLVGSVEAVSGEESQRALFERRYHHALVDLRSVGDDAQVIIGALSRSGCATTLLLTDPLEPETYGTYLRLGVRQLLQRPIGVDAILASINETHVQITTERFSDDADSDNRNSARADKAARKG